MGHETYRFNHLSERFFKNDFKTRILISTTAYNDAVNQHMLDEFDFVFTEYSESLLLRLFEITNNNPTNRGSHINKLSIGKSNI